MESLIVINTDLKGKTTCHVLPLNHYQCLSKTYRYNNKDTFEKYLSDFFKHYGILISWDVVDKVEISM